MICENSEAFEKRFQGFGQFQYIQLLVLDKEYHFQWLARWAEGSTFLSEVKERLDNRIIFIRINICNCPQIPQNPYLIFSGF